MPYNGSNNVTRSQNLTSLTGKPINVYLFSTVRIYCVARKLQFAI